MRPPARCLLLGLAAASLTTLLTSSCTRGVTYDLVIARGRVIDAESGLDAVRNIGIADGRIEAVADTPLSGRAVINASGLVVAPGFIDLHSHAQTPETYGFQALDGVTTALEMEVGTADVDAWYAERQNGRTINFGASVGHIPVRMAVMHDPGTFLPAGPAAHRAATPEEIAEIIRRLNAGLDRGAVGVGAGLPYVEAASREELLEVFRVAGTRHASIHVHIRPGIAGLQEAMGLAAPSNASLHIVHLNSAGTKETPQMLAIIGDARAAGRDITTEAYPYDAGMTEITSAILDQYEKLPDERITAELEWPRTGEKLTRETFEKYRATGGPVIRRTNTEQMVATAIASPLTAIASDAYWENGTGHPRTAGTYARVLGRYARDTHALSLVDAIRKMTLMPAERLQSRVPAMRNKGRLRVGADADVTIFDAARVADRSTYKEPSLPSDGIVHVIVNGVPVVADGKLAAGAAPGRAVRAPAH